MWAYKGRPLYTFKKDTAPGETNGAAPTAAIRGPVLTFTGDPFKEGLEQTMVYETDAIVAFGGAAQILIICRLTCVRQMPTMRAPYAAKSSSLGHSGSEPGARARAIGRLLFIKLRINSS